MLRDSSADAVVLLTQKLAEANVCVDSMPQSPLHEAVMACYTPLIENVVSEQNQSNDPNIAWAKNVLVNGSMAKGLDGVVKHDTIIDNIVDVAAKSIQASIHMARNVVNPVVKAVIADIETELHKAEINVTNQLAVLPRIYKNIWNSPVLEGMVERYEDSAVTDLRLAFVHKPLTPQELMELVKSGSGRFNEEIEAWVGEIGPEFLATVYRDTFCSDNEMAQHDDAVMLSPSIDGATVDMDRVLAIHFMARKLKTSVQEDINMSLSDYREYMANVIEQSGRAVCRIMEKRARDKKQRVLIVRYPAASPDSLYAKESYIEVNADVYNQWLEEGGTPEVIMGAFLYDRETGYSQTLENKEHYKAVWDRRAQLLRSQAYSARYNTTVQALGVAVAKQINLVKDEELPVQSRAVLHQRLAECLNDMNVKKVEDIYLCARRVVCHVMFAHTNAEEILDNIDAACKANPGIDIREAALLAVIDVVVDWIASQFTVTKSNPA